MGGEKGQVGKVRLGIVGSPPHGRGKVATWVKARMREGITPAWAGKSARSIPTENVRWDHPRMGGEKLWGLWTASLTRGSPPHGRGKGNRRAAISPRSRITPAWAGKRIWRCPHEHFFQDHPRVGGEKTWTQCKLSMTLGSPPRGRGKDLNEVCILIPQGITPAWAGKSHQGQCRDEKHGDHPRVGGEKVHDKRT